MEEAEVQQPQAQTPPGDGKKLSVDEFAKTIKTKFPAYESKDNKELVDAWLKKYPVYADKVDLSPKKKEISSPTSLSLGRGIPTVQDFGKASSIPYTTAYESTHDDAIQRAKTVRQNTTELATPKKNKGVLDAVSEAAYLPAFNKGFNELVTKPLSGANDFIDRTIDKVYRGITGDETPSWLRKGTALDNIVKSYDEAYQKRDKPTNIVSEIGEGVVGQLPLVASMFTGEGEASMAMKAPQLFGKATKILATTGAANAYKDATDKGEGYVESAKQAVKGGEEGAISGMTMDAQMLLGGALGKGVVNKLAEKGLFKGGKATEAILHAIATGTVFGGTGAAEDLLNGKDINTHEAMKQFGMGLAMELPLVAKGINSEFQSKGIDTKAAQTAAVASSASNLNAESALRTLINTPTEQLQQINELPGTHEDLYASSIEQGAKAYEADNLSEKRNAYANQLLLKTQGDVKLLASKIAEPEQKAQLEDAVRQSEIPDESKQELLTKIETLTKTENNDGEKTNVAPDQEKEGRPGQQVAERPEVSQKSEEEGGQRLNEEPAPRDGEEVVTEGAENAPLKKFTDDELEKRMNELEELAPKFGTTEDKEHSAIEKELIKREREGVFNKPLKDVPAEIDRLIKKSKEQPNGFDTFAEMRELNETKAVANKYLNPDDISDREIKKDFSDALFGNPDTWYADGLKLRESLNLATERGISLEDLKERYINQFLKDGYSEKDANEVLAEKLSRLQPKEVISENKQIGEKQNATQEGKIEEGDLGEHIGVSQGKDIPKDEEKVREETRQQAGDSGSIQPIEEVKVTGIKKAVTESLRTEKQLPKVKLSPSLKDYEVLKKGKELVEKGTADPEKIADRIIAEGGNYHHENEAPAMLYYAHQLDRASDELQSKISDAEETGNEEAKTLLISDQQILDDKISKMTEANRINSNSWGKLGNIMQIESDQSFSPANVRSIIKDNYGGKIPKDVEARLKSIEAERDQALRDLKKATEKQIKNDGEKAVEKIRKSIKLVKQSKAELEAEANDLVAELRKALKRDFGRVNAGIPIPTETLAVLGKLAVNYFKQGVKDFEGLANKIYDDLKETGIEKSQVREYLSTYEPLREESKERRMTLLGRKERMLNKQLETGKIRDYSRKPEIVFKKDNEVIKAEQRIADAEYKLKQEKSKSYRQTDNKYQRGLNWIIRWERRSVLASPLILEKLASAATIGSAVNRIPKQLIGGAFSAIFKKVAEKAPIEGGLNMDAEIKFWKEFGNPQKFVNNAWEILKTGASPLTKKYSSRTYEHFAGYDALMDLHAIIKDPPKRATFEASLKYAYEWAAKNDLDYTDPLIKKSLENAAYKRAEYEIFQEDNGVAKRVNDFLNSERKRNNEQATYKALLRFLVPISTVPLNIVRRVGSNIFGLPRGLYEVTKSYRNGIDNLTSEQADFIMRQLKNGSTGLAYYTFGLFASKAILGGLWNKDDKKGSKPHFNQAAFNEMKVGQYSVDKRIQHALPLQMTQLGATTARVYNYYLDMPTDDPKYQAVLKAAAQAMAATTGTQIEEIPMINEPKQAIESFSDPYERKKFAEDLKRRVGFSILDDLGITKKDTQNPLDKKLSSITNDEGDKVKLTPTQLDRRKKAYDNAIKENKSDWTAEFDDEWESDKNVKERNRLSKYWKQIGRSESYIKEKISDMKQDALDKYIEKQAVDETSEIDFTPPTKNKFSIK